MNNITSRANRMLGLVSRNLRKTSQKIRQQAYFSLVRPHLEYCCSVWNPHTNKHISIEAYKGEQQDSPSRISSYGQVSRPWFIHWNGRAWRGEEMLQASTSCTKIHLKTQLPQIQTITQHPYGQQHRPDINIWKELPGYEVPKKAAKNSFFPHVQDLTAFNSFQRSPLHDTSFEGQRFTRQYLDSRSR